MSMLNDLSLSEDQVSVLSKITHFLSSADSNRELRIGGLAGTGKTTMIAKFLNDSRHTLPFPISFATFTGKAAERLMHTFKQFNLQIDVRTLHKLLYTTKIDPLTKQMYSIENETLPQFIVIDEASMVSKEYYNLIMKPSKKVSKIIFVGDHGQLPPITKDGETPFNLMENPTIRLEQIHRQCEGNPVIELAYAIRKASSVSEVIRMINQSAVRKVSKAEGLHGSLVLAQNSTWNDVVHLVYKNTTRVHINQMMNEQAPLDSTEQPVIVLRNTHFDDGVFLANGSRGLVKSFIPRSACPFDSLNVDFPFSGLISDLRAPRDVWNNPKPNTFFEDRELTSMDWAYAITCHKAQGSSWKHVFVWLNDVYRSDLDMFKRWVYTAITRTENQVYFVL